MKHIISQLLIGLFFLTPSVFAQPAAQDIPGAKDHPLLKRFEGSIILRHNTKNFDEFTIPLEKVVFDYDAQQFKDFKRLKVEGSRTTNFYCLPPNASTLEAIKNYELDLREKGFEVLFSGSKEELDNGYGRFVKQVYTSETDYDRQTYTMAGATDYRYIALKKASPQGDTYVAVFSAATTSSWKDSTLAAGQVLVRVDVIATKPLDNRMVKVTAAEMAQQLSTTGRIALYGIYFDFNKTEIKPESEQTLEEIAKLLRQSVAMRVIVVGHTDAVGTFEFNKDLSERRARAVAEALASRYAIAKSRLLSFGASFAAPIASNESEDGRAKNRRVELVSY
jgi:OmpA-OmpF porin, OOP family